MANLVEARSKALSTLRLLLQLVVKVLLCESESKTFLVVNLVVESKLSKWSILSWKVKVKFSDASL